VLHRLLFFYPLI